VIRGGDVGIGHIFAVVGDDPATTAIGTIPAG